MTDAPDSAALLTLAGQGDRAALSALYRRYERPVYRFILSKLNDPHEAADILQDVFMDVWRSASRFEGRSKVQTWIFGIAWRKTIDAHRKRGRMATTGDEMPDIEDDNVNTEACVLAGQEAAHVHYCLGELSEDHRTAVRLAFLEDMSYRAIAEVLDAAEGTIKTRVFHAKKLLLRCLQGRVQRGAGA